MFNPFPGGCIPVDKQTACSLRMLPWLAALATQQGAEEGGDKSRICMLLQTPEYMKEVSKQIHSELILTFHPV